MNEQNQNFETLKQLLKLKRHEVPPPGYFNNFSDQVISRIRAGEAGGAATFMDRLEMDAPWVVSFLRIFETRPGVVGAFATSLCLVLLLVVVFTENLWEANNPTRAWELGQLAALQGLKRKAEQTLDRAGRHRTLGRQYERRHPLLVYRVFDCTDPL